MHLSLGLQIEGTDLFYAGIRKPSVGDSVLFTTDLPSIQDDNL